MFARKINHKSGVTYIQVVEKDNKKYKVLKSFGGSAKEKYPSEQPHIVIMKKPSHLCGKRQRYETEGISPEDGRHDLSPS